MRWIAPLLIILLVAGHALAGADTAATASHAPAGPATIERVAAVALALLLVLGLARLQRHRR